MYYVFVWIGNEGKEDLGKYLVFCLVYWIDAFVRWTVSRPHLHFPGFLPCFWYFWISRPWVGAFQKLLSIGVSCFMHFGSKTQLFSNILQYFTSSHACLFISKFQHCIGSTSPFFLQRVGKSWQRNTFPALTRWQIPH